LFHYSKQRLFHSNLLSSSCLWSYFYLGHSQLF